MKTRKKMRTYIFIVILPLIILSIIYWLYLEQSIQKERQQKAEWIGYVSQKYIDQVISETKKNLDSLSFKGSFLNEEKMNIRIHKLKESNPRYAGVFWLNQDGVSISGTNPKLLHSYLIEQDDIDRAVKTHKAVVVSKKEKSNSTFDYFSIFSPILDNDKNVQGFILAQIRMDYLENTLEMLALDQSIILQASNGTPIFNINVEDIPINPTWVKIPLAEVNWSLAVKMPDQINTSKMNVFLMFIFFTFVFTHMIYIIVLELSDRRETEKQKQLIEVQKLEVAGTLAASTAHEIKNPLTGIKGLIQLLTEKNSDEQDQFYYSVIMKEIERINSIISEFLVLGKPIAQTLYPYDIRGIIAELRPIIESEARFYNIEVEWTIEKAPIIVYCTKDQLKQVMLNITKNGFEAMEHGRTLTIRVYPENEEAKIEITDTGHGLDKKAIHKVFEPFYTSKKQGTGLGLFVCKRIIELFNGRIELTSKPLKGTTVTISLPISKECIGK